jgi:hypothetical protein
MWARGIVGSFRPKDASAPHDPGTGAAILIKIPFLCLVKARASLSRQMCYQTVTVTRVTMFLMVKHAVGDSMVGSSKLCFSLPSHMR